MTQPKPPQTPLLLQMLLRGLMLKSKPKRGSRQQLIRGLVGTTILILAVSLLLVWRRAVGLLELGGSLPAVGSWTVLLWGSILTLWALGVRRFWREKIYDFKTHKNDWQERFIGWGPSISLIAILFVCGLPADHFLPWLLLVPMIVADQFWRESFFDNGKLASEAILLAEKNESYSVVENNNNESLLNKIENSLHLEPESEDFNVVPEAGIVLQQLTRVRDVMGVESLYGILRAEFTKGQQTATIHVGFCPPLNYTPTVNVEVLEGPEARIKIVQSLPQGARIEVRLRAAAIKNKVVTLEMAAFEQAIIKKEE